MLKNTIYIAGILFLFSCQNLNTENEKKINGDSSKKIDSSIQGKDAIISKDTPGFFSNCHELISHSWLGTLQAVKADKDSLKNLYFAACYDCKETHEIIFLNKDVNKREDINYDSLSEEFKNGCKDYFKGFACFAFVCQMRDPDKQKDVHAMNIDFPVEVKVYERISGDKWKFIQKSRVNTFEEYARLQFRSIYKLP